MADQAINALPTKTSPSTGDKMLMIGAAEEYQIDYDQLATAILNKLTSKTFTLDQGTKTLVAALNELNSKTSRKMNFRTATSFENAWNTCPVNSLDSVLITTSLSDPDAPSNACNTWFIQQWKNNEEAVYSWRVAWSFSSKIYSKYSSGSGFSGWIEH